MFSSSAFDLARSFSSWERTVCTCFWYSLPRLILINGYREYHVWYNNYTVWVKVLREGGRKEEGERESQCQFLSTCLSCCCFFHMSSTLLLEAFADDCANVSNLFFLDSRLFEISTTKIVTSEKCVPHVHMALPTSKC